MRRLAVYALVWGILTSLILTAMSSAEVKNPGNPCNPCEAPERLRLPLTTYLFSMRNSDAFTT